jgi:vancomycin resistance protein YoaR
MNLKIHHLIVAGAVLGAYGGHAARAQNLPAPHAAEAPLPPALQKRSSQPSQQQVSRRQLSQKQPTHAPSPDALYLPPLPDGRNQGQPASAAPDRAASTTLTGPLPPMGPSPLSSSSDLEPNSRPVRSRPSVGGVSIRGLSNEEALSRLREVLALPLLNEPITLSDGKNNFTLRRDQLGATIPLATLLREAFRADDDVPVRYEVDPVRARRALVALAERINRKPGRVGLDADDEGNVIVRGNEVVEVAIEGSLQRVRQALEAQPSRTRVELVVTRKAVEAKTKPLLRPTKGIAKDRVLQKMRYLLAEYSTHYRTSAGLAGRTENLRIAAREVNGTIVPAGAVFSTNLAIGRRSAAAGWQEAHMFVGGGVVDGVGAGICQCATTLYNAALLAGLPIVERHQHSFRVSYVPPSRDATIYWGGKDMRFRNNTSGPIYVQTFLRDQRFYVRLYGTEPVRQKIQVVSRTLSRAKGGTKSEAYRIVYSPGGGMSQQRLSRDYYQPFPD